MGLPNYVASGSLLLKISLAISISRCLESGDLPVLERFTFFRGAEGASRSWSATGILDGWAAAVIR
jgi:hypothetical protein